MTLFIVILISILVVIFCVLAISLYAYFETFYINKKELSNISQLSKGQLSDDELEKLSSLIAQFKNDEFEKVSIESFDGVMLNAKYYEYNENAPLQIVFHGYRSEGYRDFAGGMKLAKELNHNVLMVEQRGHGESDYRSTTLGMLEKYDCVYWVKYAVKRFGLNVKIILTGISMGASTVLMASNLKLPSNVCAIIADSPFSSPNDIILKVLKDKNVSSNIVMPFIKFGALVYGGFKFDKIGAVDAVKETNIPILILHGEDDSFVPTYMSKEIYYNCSSKKELCVIEKADHCRGYLVDENKYANVVKKFIKEII